MLIKSRADARRVMHSENQQQEKRVTDNTSCLSLACVNYLKIPSQKKVVVVTTVAVSRCCAPIYSVVATTCDQALANRIIQTCMSSFNKVQQVEAKAKTD